MKCTYNQIIQIEGQKSIKEFNASVDELYTVLQEKIDDKKEEQLQDYLLFIQKKAENKSYSYLDMISKDTEFLKTKSLEISKIINLFTRRIKNEITYSSEKSTEISLNILNETHSRLNKNIRKIEKNYNSFYSITQGKNGEEKFILINKVYCKEEKLDENRKYIISKIGEPNV